MSEQFEYKNPEVPTAEEVEQLLVGDDPRSLAEALIGLSLGCEHFHESYRVVTLAIVVNHVDPGVRGAAVLCLGHLARIHRQMPAEPTVTLIRKALVDPDLWVRGQAENAKADMEIYAPPVAALLGRSPHADD